ncbi:hypothetical protein ALC53_08548 [Atta colombica]|uniref:Uncharacterized protein n=1 Tax=Atta colombica TaxID=520822 RepID=A0A151I2F8_9HYME|nr:hypothetical protein ALC53_08548 [Atta colombica]
MFEGCILIRDIYDFQISKDICKVTDNASIKENFFLKNENTNFAGLTHAVSQAASHLSLTNAISQLNGLIVD